MPEIFPVERARVEKDSGRLFKGDAMFVNVDFSLSAVPGKHICVYTVFTRLIRQNSVPAGLRRHEAAL